MSKRAHGTEGSKAKRRTRERALASLSILSSFRKGNLDLSVIFTQLMVPG